jgi:hypothetical protein
MTEEIDKTPEAMPMTKIRSQEQLDVLKSKFKEEDRSAQILLPIIEDLLNEYLKIKYPAKIVKGSSRGRHTR